MSQPASSAGAVDESPKPNRRPLIYAAIAVLAVALIAGSYLSTKSADRASTAKLSGVSSAVPIKQGDPNEIAERGSKMLLVTKPPARTRALLSLPPGTPTQEFEIEFEPYGVAPSGGLVIRVSKATPKGDGAEAAELAKQLAKANMVVETGSSVDAAAFKGGRYTGTVSTVPKDGAFAFALKQSEAVR